jgi:hypothetical protein
MFRNNICGFRSRRHTYHVTSNMFSYHTLGVACGALDPGTVPLRVSENGRVPSMVTRMTRVKEFINVLERIFVL